MRIMRTVNVGNVKNASFPVLAKNPQLLYLRDITPMFRKGNY